MHLKWIFPDKELVEYMVVELTSNSLRLQFPVIDMEGKMNRPDRIAAWLAAAKDSFPDTVRELSYDYMSRYNQELDTFIKAHPLVSDHFWQMVRRGCGPADFHHIPAEWDKSGFKVDSDSDYVPSLEEDEMAIMAHLENFFDSTHNQDRYLRPITMDQEPRYDLLESRVDPTLEVKIYTFKDWKERVYESIWDYRQQEVPRFCSPTLNIF